METIVSRETLKKRVGKIMSMRRHKNERNLMLYNYENDTGKISNKNLDIILNNWFEAVYQASNKEFIRGMVTDPYISDIKENDSFIAVESCICIISNSSINSFRKMFLIGQLLNLMITLEAGVCTRGLKGFSTDERFKCLGKIYDKMVVRFISVSDFFKRKSQRPKIKGLTNENNYNYYRPSIMQSFE